MTGSGPSPQPTRSAVLLTEADLFQSIGGGQTVYKNLIAARRDLDFYYLRRYEPPDAPRPANAFALPVGAPYGDPPDPVAPPLRHFYSSFRSAMDVGRTVASARAAGLAPARFDTVDTPDYRYEGLFIRFALQAHGIEVGQVALALHGVLSSAFTGAWSWSGGAGRLFAELHLRERLQYRAADIRYGLSEAYIDALERRSPLGATYIDPVAVIRPTTPTLSPPQDRPPDIAFIGRKERRKGPDVLLDALWWAPAGTWRHLRLIGPHGENHQGRSGGEILASMAAARGLSFQDEPGLDQAGLQALCRDKTLLAVPSRYDQFNLVALEGLLDGCPTLIGRGAGVSRFVEERLPSLASFISDFGCEREAALQMHAMARDYQSVRERTAEAVDRAGLRPDRSTLQAMYAPGRGGDARVQRRLRTMAEQFMLAGPSLLEDTGPEPPRDPVLLAAGALALSVHGVRREWGRLQAGVGRRAPRLAFAASHPVEAANRFAELRLADGIPHGARGELHLIASRPGVVQHLADLPERTVRQIAGKIDYLNLLVSERRVDRVRWFSDLARLERLRDRPVTAAAYDLRIMRWLGADRFQALPRTVEDLRLGGLEREAEVAEALYGDPAAAPARCAAILDAQRQRWRGLPVKPLQVVDDRRAEGQPKVSVIVSLYNAADKLARFLRMLGQQTLVGAGAAEIVLIDSGSPADERAAFEAAWPAENRQVVYARSAERETIQAAWNRGIRLARGEYLTFLGVDEGLRPDGLEILAGALDADPDIDWAMADALVTEVDRHGVFARDIMSYDRSGYQQALCYLDSTYLAYVGGLYRRTVHDRFGWYDEDFRAAGDTEFKNRILPHIRTLRIDAKLGVFNNYPDDRASQSPRAEIEDLRAWYLHRSEAGMNYAFATARAEEELSLLAAAFSYRKCHTTHQSTDLDVALSLARRLARRSGEDLLAQTISAAIGDLRRMDLWDTPEQGVRAQYRLAGLIHKAKLHVDRAAAMASARSSTQVFNDNRYEQHHWSWSIR